MRTVKHILAALLVTTVTAQTVRIQLLPNNYLRVSLGAPHRQIWDLQTSTNMVEWRTVPAEFNANIAVRDYYFTNQPPQRFFRASFNRVLP